MEKPVRLDKFLADAGAGTRSEVKKYIQKGQVQVNGKSVKKPELKVTEEDQVVMNGQKIHAAPEYVYSVSYTQHVLRNTHLTVRCVFRLLIQEIWKKQKNLKKRSRRYFREWRYIWIPFP